MLGHDRFAVTVRSQIPVARGLGSSAALAAAAAAAAGAEDPFAVAAAYDGHPENAAASVFGGLVAATTVEGRPGPRAAAAQRRAGLRRHRPRAQPGHPRGPAACCPRRSRGPTRCSTSGRMGLLVAGLADPAYLVAEATDDRIHQPARTALFPEAPASLRGPGRRGRAGRQLVGCGSDADRHRARVGSVDVCASQRAEAALASSGVPGRVLVLRADRRGIVYGDEAEVPL